MPPGLLALRARSDAPDARLRALRARPGAASARLGTLHTKILTPSWGLCVQASEPRLSSSGALHSRLTSPDREAFCLAREAPGLALRAPGLACKASSLVVARLGALHARQGNLVDEASCSKCKARSLARKAPSPTVGVQSLACKAGGPCTQGFLLRAQDREPRIQGARPDGRDPACAARASEAHPERCRSGAGSEGRRAEARVAAP